MRTISLLLILGICSCTAACADDQPKVPTPTKVGDKTTPPNAPTADPTGQQKVEQRMSDENIEQRWKSLSVGPSERLAHVGVWDSVADRLIVFGGQTNIFDSARYKSSNFNNDLWAFDPKAKTWTQLKPTGTGPDARAWAAGCFDPTRNGLWVHGGYGAADAAGNKFRADLWFYSCKDNSWKQIAPTQDKPGPLPAARDGHVLTIDAAGKRLTLGLGLLDLTKMTLADDWWSLDIQNQAWTRLETKGDKPAARFAPAYAHDAATDTIYVLSGFDADYKPTPGNLHALDCKTMTWSMDKAQGPTAASGVMCVYPASKSLWVMGTGAGASTERWYDLGTKTWGNPLTMSNLKGRNFAAGAINPKTGVAYIMGGVQNVYNSPCLPAHVWGCGLEVPASK